MDLVNILVRMPNWLGDIVMATPVLQQLRERYPTAHIVALLPEAFVSLLALDPHVNEVVGFTAERGWRRYRQMIDRIRQGNFDLGILLTNSFSSAYVFYAGGVKERLGYVGDGRGFLLTKGVPFPAARKTQHLVKTYQELVGGEGRLAPRLYLAEEEEKRAFEEPYVGLNPGAAYGPAKMWPKERYRALAHHLSERYLVVVFGDSKSQALVDEITVGLSDRVINLAGKTSLRELMRLIRGCAHFVTNDSGPMHMADALGTPLTALFGSTDPIVTGPFRSKEVVQHRVPCGPCFKRECPLDMRCMKAIDVNEVLERVFQPV